MAITAGLVLVPGVAFATNVSSSDGSGTQRLTAEYKNGWRATGDLRSTRGEPVYYAGNVVYNFNTDHNCGRYTGDTSKKYHVGIGGTCSGPIGVSSADAAQYKVCKNVNNLPDPCGSWSSHEYF